MSAQTDRVLHALERAGTSGICQVDFLAPDVCDNGLPITRLGARILEFKEHGHEIVSMGWRHKTRVYVLTGVRPVTGQSPGRDGGADTLFDGSVGKAKPRGWADQEAA